MRLMGQIAIACLILAALRWIIAATAVAIVVGVGVALIRAPAKTLTLLFGIVLLNAFVAHPALGLTVFLVTLLSTRIRCPN